MRLPALLDIGKAAIVRTARGVPIRVDGIKRLGNSVVPAVAQAIGQAINDAIKKKPRGKG